MTQGSKHIKGCTECKNKKNDGSRKLCKTGNIQRQQALLCFFRSVINVPFERKYFKYYRNLLQNLGGCYAELNCPNKSSLCYHRVVEIDNKLVE